MDAGDHYSMDGEGRQSMTGGERESTDGEPRDLDGLLDAAERRPCKVCGAAPDFLLYRAGREPSFACWEHASPVAADVDGTPDGSGRPVAIPVSERFS